MIISTSGSFSLCFLHFHACTCESMHALYTHICDASVPACQGFVPAAVILMMLRNIHAAAVTTAPILCPVYVRCPAGPTA